MRRVTPSNGTRLDKSDASRASAARLGEPAFELEDALARRVLLGLRVSRLAPGSRCPHLNFDALRFFGVFGVGAPPAASLPIKVVGVGWRRRVGRPLPKVEGFGRGRFGRRPAKHPIK